MADDLIRRSDALKVLTMFDEDMLDDDEKSPGGVSVGEINSAIMCLPTATPTMQEAAKVPELAKLISAFLAAISFETHRCNIDQMPGGNHE